MAVRILAIMLCCAALCKGQSQTSIVGVLEDNPGHYAEEPHYRTVRIVFRHDGSGWTAFPSKCGDQRCLATITSQFPRQMDWTVAFDGREVGQVTARTPETFDYYSSIGQQVVVSGSPPVVGKQSTEFGGFLGEEIYRPLIAVSTANYNDPEEWKPTKLSREVIVAVRTQFRKQFPKVTNCTKRDIENARAWVYQDENIKTVKAYGSNRGWILAEVELQPYLCGGPSDEPFAARWFVLSPDASFRALGSAMWLVDAGDYDGDGKSEVVFSIDDYNRGGYRLFYDDFKKKAEFSFSYH